MAHSAKKTCVFFDGAAFRLSDFTGRQHLKDDGNDGQDDEVNQALAGTSKQSMEPIIIGDYKTMNYFSQAASDVTIYLNTEESFMVDGQNHYRVDENGVIDLTKSQEKTENSNNHYCRGITETPQEINGATRIPEFLKPTFNYNKFHESSLPLQATQEIDAPEYIDISKLQAPLECLLYPIDAESPSKKNTLVPSFLKRNRQNKWKPATVTSINEPDGKLSSSEDEVIFIKEFKAEDLSDPLDLSSAKTKCQIEPRRNPKRQVQLLKASTDLTLKLSDADIYYGMVGNTFKDYYMEIPRRPSRTTGATFNPPTALTNFDYKEWPADGMHERPIFNNTTKKIDKFDLPKPRKGPAKNKDVAKPAPRKRGFARKIRKVKQTGKSKTNEINKEFAALTHDTLQEVIDYVLQVKVYNEIKKRSKSSMVLDDQREEEETSKPYKCLATINEILGDVHKEKNLMNAADLLADSCLLYSLANGVCHADIAKYLASYKKDNLVEE